jgi:hypothetical protein
MKHLSFSIMLLIPAALLAQGSASTPAGFPWHNETLRYSVNWPSGLSLGEASMSAVHGDGGWKFDVSLDAGVPGFALKDKLHSATEGNDLCSLQLDRDLSHGAKKVREKTTFDQKNRSAVRTTVFPENGGKTDLDVSSCARDALAFVYFARREMGQGRVAPAQKLYLGSAYNVRMEYTGPVTIKSGDKPAVTDKVVVSAKGPQSNVNFEIYFARDAARTPLSVKIPVAVGMLSLDLMR